MSPKRRGFTLIEVLVSVGILALVGASIYGIFVKMVRYSSDLRARSLSSTMANEHFEVIRNLPYASVGIQGGIPVGVLPHTQTVTRGNKRFLITTTIRNIDDPFDGTIGGIPNDLSPADNKLVEIQVDCLSCTSSTTTIFSGRIAPKNLETASNNGALFVKVFNANGQPVEGANVHLVHTTATSSIVIDDVTNVNGLLQIVDAPPGDNAWSINVTGSGYSTDQTYATSSANPSPIKRHATVLNQQVTQVSFAIDKLSTVTVRTKNKFCVPEGSVGFSFIGSKLIGTPDVKKASSTYTTASNGAKVLSDIEWDSYQSNLTGSTYYLVGTNPLLPWNILPDATQSIDIIVAAKDKGALLVSVKDSATGLPISDADVNLTATGYDETEVTSQGHISQSDWSGGSGQTDFSNITKYAATDGNIEASSPAGDIKLRYNSFLGRYESSGWITSSIFDVGTSSNFSTLEWKALDQPTQTGTDSVKFQIASSDTNTATTTWNYVGPGGSSGAYYTTSDRDLVYHSNKQYIRYKVFLSTADTDYTPQLSDISMTYATECTPPGQVFFNGLNTDTYDLTITKTGYDTYTESNISITNSTQVKKSVSLEN
jgi:prepilin-type N-terminal cleavage/methylation domain-containing protein